MHELPVIIAFIITVVVALAVDLFVGGKKPHAVTSKEAATWTGVWVSLSLIFAAFIWWDLGKQPAVEFLTAYTIEKALSVDNLFVFILVFNYFQVPEEYKHKVLFWGILGAIVLRAVFIFAGVGLINLTYITIAGYQINVLLGLFGLFLVYAGVKSGLEVLKGGEDDEENDFTTSPGAKLVKWMFGGKVTDDYVGDKFFVKQQVREENAYLGQMAKYTRYITPLLVVVGVIEFTDLLFAVDSIPAIFSVSKDPFILYSSNIFAILGLRTMYFLLNNFIKLFRFLPHGLAIILTFIGVKMVIAPWIHISSVVSLLVVAGILVASTCISAFTKEA